ncbi:hypothetical protein PYCC9005_005294 [Savitreella phatthalungensis]
MSSKRLVRLAASFVRGGTSNGLLIHRRDLPEDVKAWQPILAAAMGSPDRYGRQLDGMGSGISSTSKICVVDRSRRPDAELEYTFVQVGIRDGSLDTAGNCGNMSAAVAPWGLLEGLVPQQALKRNDKGETTIRIFNTNTQKLIESTFALTQSGEYSPAGEYAIDGVPGTGSRITMAFVDPAGAKTGKALPTGNPVDLLELHDGTMIEASLVDVANPGVFVRACDIGVSGEITPATLESEANRSVMEKLEAVRQAGARAMGLDPTIQSVPKVVMVSPPGSDAIHHGVHIVCRALSMQQPHRAVPLTLALCLGAACTVTGSIPEQAAKGLDRCNSTEVNVCIAHASGKLEVGATLDELSGQITRALLHRTARVLMRGEVELLVDMDDDRR